MNEEKEEAVAYFREAYDLQKLLVEQGKDKLEHLARSAYYLGSLLDDSKKKRNFAFLMWPRRSSNKSLKKSLHFIWVL